MKKTATYLEYVQYNQLNWHKDLYKHQQAKQSANDRHQHKIFSYPAKVLMPVSTQEVMSVFKKLQGNKKSTLLLHLSNHQKK